jgi:predicted nuclease with TOPRIM domain
MNKTIQQIEVERERAIALAQRVAIAAFGNGVPDDLNQIEALLQAEPAQRSKLRAEHIESSSKEKLAALESQNSNLNEKNVSLENEVKVMRAKVVEIEASVARRAAELAAAAATHKPANIGSDYFSGQSLIEQHAKETNPAKKEALYEKIMAELR